MFYRFIFLLGIFILSSCFANVFKDLKSFKADFTQEIKNSSNSSIKYEGEVFIKSSGKVLWKYKAPVFKNVYINEDFAIVDEPDLEQAIFTSLDNKVDIIRLLNSAKQISENKYETKLYEIKYEITVKNEKISKISYTDNLENKITISFFNIEQNIKLEDSLFKFLAPDYYDIIRK